MNEAVAEGCDVFVALRGAEEAGYHVGAEAEGGDVLCVLSGGGIDYGGIGVGVGVGVGHWGSG